MHLVHVRFDYLFIFFSLFLPDELPRLLHEWLQQTKQWKMKTKNIYLLFIWNKMNVDHNVVYHMRISIILTRQIKYSHDFFFCFYKASLSAKRILQIIKKKTGLDQWTGQKFIDRMDRAIKFFIEDINKKDLERILKKHVYIIKEEEKKRQILNMRIEDSNKRVCI